MTKVYQFAAFFIVFLAIYLGIHFYVFFRMYDLFYLKKSTGLIILISLLALSFPLFSILERFHHSAITRGLYIMSATWVGVMAFLFTSLLVFELIRLFFKNIDTITSGMVIIFIVIFLAIVSIVNAYYIETKHIVIPMKNLEKNMTLVQISDVHLGTIHNVHFLRRIVEKTNNVNPDAVLITGDLFDGGGALNGEISALLNQFKAETFFTTGNHERYVGLDNAMTILNKTKIRILNNAAVDYRGLQIVGVEDTYDDFSRPDDFISRIPMNKSLPTVLMYHQPTGVKEANEAGIDLQLSGHTHDGQFFPFNLVVMGLTRYSNGLYDYNGTKIYVTSGTGTWGPPMRLFSRNEIVVVHLVPKSSS